MTVRTDAIPTVVGRLHVTVAGEGPPTVLWHSLFLDTRSWCGLQDHLAGQRTVVTIDGPSHGQSEPIARGFTFADCVTAAEQVLDALGITGPVDWVGNAWGGHVGIQLATHRPARIRTLTTIGTPAHGLRPLERWAMIWPLVQVYRAIGPAKLLLRPLSDGLIGSESAAAQPALAADVMSAFTGADRPSMFRAMRSMMLHRPDMSADMARVTVPTLLIVPRDDTTGWQPADARKVAATMANATVVEAAGSGHSSPLLIDRATVEKALADFWETSQPV